MKLTVNEIAFLSGAYRERSPLSLFANVSARQDGTEEKSLGKKGVYVNGILSPHAKEMLDIAAGAEKCVRIAVKDSSCVVEKYVYRKGEKKLLVENDAGDLLFSIPEGWSATLAELSEFTGISRIKRSSVEILLPAEEMMVLLAVIDIARTNTLNSYIGKNVENGPIAYADVVQYMENPRTNSFVNMLKKNYNYPVPEAGKVGALLGRLSEMGCIRFENGCSLQAEYAVFANSFLIPDTVVIMEAFNADEHGRVTSGAALCVCAGVKDIASFIFSPEGIEFSSISGMQLMQMVENFLNCPDITG